MDARESIVRDGLEVARRVADQVGEVPPTLFVLRPSGTDWKNPIDLATPSEYARAADMLHATAVVIVGSHTLIDADHPGVPVIRLYCGVVNARGEVLVAGKQLRWADQPKWTEPSITAGPLPVAVTGWRV